MQKFPQLAAMGVPAEEYATLSSTNVVAKKKIVEGTAPTTFLVSAREQTAGHGKLNRSFYSPAGSGVYFSLGLAEENIVQNNDPAKLTVTAAVAAFLVLERHFMDSLAIKWVNDLYVGDKKVAGILAETAVDGANHLHGVVIGWGINLVTPPDLPSALTNQVGGLSPLMVSNRERLNIIDETGAQFIRLLAGCSWEQILQIYREHQLLAGKKVVVESGLKKIAGQFDHISDRGGLCLQTTNGVEEIRTGTVRKQ
ncbi:biotin--[acetyl-CoA-carboxylase] ligase [Limosilactobacillus panis]|jgi:BirA family biotin operon repressor/biotin-[acetyl-CoA-carboxylase] ligase|uniref:biotin--[acetyl-CoA-carboxylase] ligase n=1 Tax=Limosilactobacillus TaxID=2742598 RepID=UPI001C93EEDB|nr:biotin--[acetyl-CoA-carboxylase] ligase [Limosilactobacillus panis]QZN92282.1 biotin--[acetyl-CoA-carboxylase] ligase [Limosilactobacillus panis]